MSLKGLQDAEDVRERFGDVAGSGMGGRGCQLNFTRHVSIRVIVQSSVY